ncbi:SDR family oxidoreductase [Undibacterium sp. RTI2.1]|uniref:SDR family oxidoreductase n=1 Tax=unclassified Undibacterium TaxID=2630295 RepID=UPI002AB4F4DA|nr:MULTISPECIES: SDR family oxidoreductase [unclassified Undibacterium]MDY7538573.1 SDR family oxidoreductase [Undibacterium sp. 5I1]MEB0031262.1 SDR family oxidoreductase [Undibacterium sp. RTI2.1]MEB0116346.1 SDR family oxidoreductase [Undibacterium sp. RTI2.2]MEB0232175.1 SDR family oxidoreductase [Undibacterium sp. 10I3]MEB0258075.1 SDR family oxidoreductase [Undibacterium sp. 5I1]
MPEITFKDKSVLVTGAASGIGRAAALAFAKAGAKLTIADIDVVGAEETQAMISFAGGTVRFVKTDISKAAEVESLIAGIVNAYGRLDCAFNNAGIEIEHHALADSDEASFDKIMNVNVKGVWLCMKYEIKQMLQQGGGTIVNTASVAGLVGAPMQPIYAASKHAVVGLTKTAAAEYGRAGIRVNAVCPGVIRTPMMDNAIAREPRREKMIQKLHPIGRIGEASEIANAALWLCSDLSSFVTGHQLAVDGGLTAI